jgi:signal transduction histidine kinase
MTNWRLIRIQGWKRGQPAARVGQVFRRMGGTTDMTARGHPRAAAGETTESDRRDEQIRWALQYDQDQADGTIDSERRDARDVQERTDTQRRDARDGQDQAETDQVKDRRDARDAQDLIDDRAAAQRRDARDNQDQAETEQDSDRRDAQNLFDARRHGERREAFEQTVTDHQRAGELERTIQNLEAFSYTVSHDLRAPLRAMSGYSEALAEEYGSSLGEVGRGYVGRIQSASQQMGELIEGVLRLTRISKAEIRCHAVDLGAEAATIAAELRRSEPDRRVRFTIQQPVWALADGPLIRDVLQNLLQNAWKFTSGQDEPSIEFWMTPAPDAHVRCYVRDNGAGFDPAYTDKLFTPFQRLHTAAQYPGTGIGLASVRQILERHGGHVRAEGAVGHGATFSFTLASASPAA